jgi:exo-beta-1,3-glucanase (GH17 family)
VGKEENSMGVAVLIATMMTNSANKMFRVNSTSSITAGSGRISMVRISKITAGTANDDGRKPSVNCRRSDNVKALVAIFVYKLLGLRQFVVF